MKKISFLLIVAILLCLLLIAGILYLAFGWILFLGLKVLKPGEALVLTLFGKYVGTLKGDGFFFVNPFCTAVNPAADTKLGQSGDISDNGKGKIKSSILFTDQLESKIDRLVNKIGIRKFSLHVHPYVAAYINKGLWSLKRQWQMKYGWVMFLLFEQFSGNNHSLNF